MDLIKDIIKVAIPATLGSFVMYIIPAINIAFIGHLDDPVKLAGTGIGALIFSMVSLGPFFGMNGALETLVSQTAGGRNIHLCGVYLQRGRIINLFCLIPMLVIYLLSYKLMILFG